MYFGIFTTDALKELLSVKFNVLESIVMLIHVKMTSIGWFIKTSRTLTQMLILNIVDTFI